MVNLVDIDADHVLGVRIHDDLQSTDIDLAMDFLKKKVRNQRNIALYAEIDNVQEFDSDLISTELRHSFSQVKTLAHVERAALVTDNGSIRDNEKFLGLLPTVEVKTFSKAESESAKAWVSERA